MPIPKPKDEPTWLQLESIIPLAKVREITSLSDEAIARNHGHRMVQLSARRRGMKLKDALAIANGEAV
jgi:hypothetical protein